jgi:hypothetical protein
MVGTLRFAHPTKVKPVIPAARHDAGPLRVGAFAPYLLR